MILSHFELTDEHIKKLTELGYTKHEISKGIDRYFKIITGYGHTSIDVLYCSAGEPCLRIYLYKAIYIDYFEEIHEIDDEYVHERQTLKEDMEKVFGLDITLEQMIKEN